MLFRRGLRVLLTSQVDQVVTGIQTLVGSDRRDPFGKIIRSHKWDGSANQYHLGGKKKTSAFHDTLKLFEISASTLFVMRNMSGL